MARNGWPTRPLREVVRLAGGGAFPRDEQGDATGDYPFFKVSDMNLPGNERVMDAAANWITEEQRERLGVRSWPAGTVVFPKVGAALKTEKRRILGREGIFDNNIMGLVAGDEVVSEYLLLCLEQVRLSDSAQEGAVPSVNHHLVGGIEIPVPPILDQRRIADLLRSVSEVSAALNRTKETAIRARRTLLNDLVHPVDEDGWISGRLGDLFVEVKERVSPGDSLDLPYVGMEHLVPESRYIGPAGDPKTVDSQKTAFDTGDVLYGRLRPYLKKVARADCPGICSTEISVFRSASDQVDAEFLYYRLATEDVLAFANANTTGSRMPRIQTGRLAEFAIQIPPLSEQHRIASVMRTLDEELHQMRECELQLMLVRSALLPALLSGKHRIPESYDRLRDGMSATSPN